jgi:hypothetical protein
VHDSRVSQSQADWEGAAVKVYLSAAGATRVTQFKFSLHGPTSNLTVKGYDMSKPIRGEVPGTWRLSQVSDGMYTLEAALPLSYMDIAAWDDSFLLDAAVIAAPYRGQKPTTVWLFSPECTNPNNAFFAQATLTDVNGSRKDAKAQRETKQE